MKKSQKKLIVAILAIATLLVGGTFVYLKFNDFRSSDKNPVQSNGGSQETLKTFSGTMSDGRKYTFQYHSNLNVSVQDDRVSITKFRPGRVVRAMDCGGFVAGPDELKMSIYLNMDASQAFVNRFNNTPVISDFSQKIMRGNRNVGGMCENADEFMWQVGNKYITFTVQPSNTQLVNEYKTIVETFRLVP